MELNKEQCERWITFTQNAAKLMRAALDDLTPLEEVSIFFERAEAIDDDDLRAFVVRYVWEIDGSRNIYMDLLKMFDRGASKTDFLRYMVE